MQISVAILVSGCNNALNYIVKLIRTFKERVISDSGLFEAEACLDSELNKLNVIGLLRKASLIITPNAVKESKLYSVIPSNGNGDMSVVRATTATRVNSDGLVELVPYNLLTYSEDFSNASWTKSNLTITSNSIVAPNGTLTADTYQPNTINSYVFSGNLNITTGSYTGQVWVKGTPSSIGNTMRFLAVACNKHRLYRSYNRNINRRLAACNNISNGNINRRYKD